MGGFECSEEFVAACGGGSGGCCGSGVVRREKGGGERGVKGVEGRSKLDVERYN